eukprot:TRINITY_DN5177_c0_g2_i1.p1 TRINITY_DN5177_c0_g2~~TRINITY_DN5177_c0_g2_i1.p1  ORF type:complete len:495 (+),score=61.54 TRINITY_DN5177_c0_g2_i1:115-1485(+)
MEVGDVIRTYKSWTPNTSQWISEMVEYLPVVSADHTNFLDDLKIACRTGDMKTMRRIEIEGVPVNVRDRWDATPLYYASLCGQPEAVKYLLAKGARCEENTFDGERCLYAAHTPEIKKMLKEFKVILRTDAYHDFLRKAVNNQNLHWDIAFIIRKEMVFYAHKVILSARSSYFAQMFNTRWKTKTHVRLTHGLLNPVAFGTMLRYLYTGRMEFQMPLLGNCLLVCKQCKLDKMIEILNQLAFSRSGDDWIVYDEAEANTGPSKLQYRYSRFVRNHLPHSLTSFEVQHSNAEEEEGFWDIKIQVNEHVFKAHRVFLCGRSEYFNALLLGRFKEAQAMKDQDQLLVLKTDSPEVFAVVLEYLYSNMITLVDDYAPKGERLGETQGDLLLDVLEVADLFLLPGLKASCVNILAQHLELDNVFEMIQVARTFDVVKLEDSCIHFIALNLEEVMNSYVEKF